VSNNNSPKQSSETQDREDRDEEHEEEGEGEEDEDIEEIEEVSQEQEEEDDDGDIFRPEAVMKLQLEILEGECSPNYSYVGQWVKTKATGTLR
jgi:anti-sigma28 factor (negative regulator of flagellin synthesis)